MRLSVPGPRTLFRLVVLISLPSLLSFMYIFTQMLPMAPMPIVLTIPDALQLERDAEESLYMLATTNALSDLYFNEIQSKFNQSNATLENGIDGVLSRNSSEVILTGDTSDRGQMAPGDGPAAGCNLHHQLPTGIQALANKASEDEVERYLMENYRANQAKGLADFSSKITEEMIENGPLELPELLPNLNAPCWVEAVPPEFTYRDNIYHCHINSRRIKDGFNNMLGCYQTRQGHSGYKWRLRCLPSFYLIGVAKCGTTDLFEALTRHPQILKPDLKEPEYWPYLRFGPNDLILNMTCAKDKGRATFADYLDTYDQTSEVVKASITRDANGNLSANVIFGDYSTHTFIDILDSSLEAPDQINAHHIHNVWPQSKIILILRDPVDRSYSRYKMRMARQNGGVKGTPEDFHKRVLKQVKTTNECLEQHTRRHCVYKAKYGVGNMGTNALLNTGIYCIYMQDWLSIFPREQILILKFEEYIQNRPLIIDQIVDFLGINPLPDAYRSIIQSMGVVNGGPEIGGVLPITRDALQDFYRPYNQELVELLQDSKFSFGY